MGAECRTSSHTIEDSMRKEISERLRGVGDPGDPDRVGSGKSVILSSASDLDHSLFAEYTPPWGSVYPHNNRVNRSHPKKLGSDNSRPQAHC